MANFAAGFGQTFNANTIANSITAGRARQDRLDAVETLVAKTEKHDKLQELQAGEQLKIAGTKTLATGLSNVIAEAKKTTRNDATFKITLENMLPDLMEQAQSLDSTGNAAETLGSLSQVETSQLVNISNNLLKHDEIIDSKDPTAISEHLLKLKTLAANPDNPLSAEQLKPYLNEAQDAITIGQLTKQGKAQGLTPQEAEKRAYQAVALQRQEKLYAEYEAKQQALDKAKRDEENAKSPEKTKQAFDPEKQQLVFATEQEIQEKGLLPPPKKGITVTTNADGSTTTTIGGNDIGLTKGTNTLLEKAVITGAENLTRLDRIGKQIDDDFLTGEGAIKAKWFSLVDKWGSLVPGDPKLTQDQKDFLNKRSKFVLGVEQFFNSYRQEITGAAAAMAELERLKEATINKDLSPTEFRARHEEMVDFTRLTTRLKNKIRREGLDPKSNDGRKRLDALWSSDEDDVNNADARIAEIEGVIKAKNKNMAQEELDKAVYVVLKKEGYL